MFLSDSSPDAPEPFVAPSALYANAWHSLFKGESPHHLEIFTALVVLTQEIEPVDKEAWVYNEVNVARRWQHVIEGLGNTALKCKHPSFNGVRRNDGSEIIRATLEYIPDHIEVQGMHKPGLALSFDKKPGDNSPDVFDLRDMDEPLYLLDDVDMQTFRGLPEEQRAWIHREITRRLNATYHGTAHGPAIPQLRASNDEYWKFVGYTAEL